MSILQPCVIVHAYRPQGFKSLAFIAYELLTKYTQRFAKWASLKANAILNGMEPVFWLAIIVVTGMAASRGGGTTVIALTVIVMLIAIVVL